MLKGLVLILVVSAAGCGGMRAAPVFTAQALPSDAGLPVVLREDLLNEISTYEGVGYREGGTSLAGVDCSGLVLAVFGPLGVKLPRTAVEQFETGISVGRGDLKTGDLVFFGDRTPDHVGIAVSNREMVHASVSRGVTLDNIGAFGEKAHFRGARRVIALR